MGHLQTICERDPEMQGFKKKWHRARIPVELAVYLDILSPIPRLSLGMHDRVKQVRRIQEFQNMMKKLEDVLRKSLSETSNIMTYYKRLVKEIKEGDDDHSYQGIKLTHFENNVDSVKYEYQFVINLLIENVNSRLANIQNSAVCKNIVLLLDLRTWPISPDSSFCEAEINEKSEECADLLSRNNCEIPLIPEVYIYIYIYILGKNKFTWK